MHAHDAAPPRELRLFTTDALRAWLEQGKATAALVPVGSVEPHGPHLPLGTDTTISQTAARFALPRLEARGVRALLCPPIPYGVTDFAAGFAGAVSIPGEVLTPMLRAVVRGLLANGFGHVCLVNNHLEPAQDAAVRAAVQELDGFEPGRASVACPLTRRWGRTLSAEFKSGACHAGRYETSLVLAAEPEAVDQAGASQLPPLGTSLSDGIRAGQLSFLAMGLERAYTGAPHEASAEEGQNLYEQLAEMVATEVLEGLSASGRLG